MIPDLLIALCAKCNRFFHEVSDSTCGGTAFGWCPWLEWSRLCHCRVTRCCRFQEDLEFEVLKQGKCPFCRCSESEVGLP